MASEKLPLSYKGHPLRRKDNLIYYGTMAEKYIIMLQVLATRKVDDLEVATKVSVQLQLTDPILCKERMEEPHHAPVQSPDREAGRLYPGGHRCDHPFLCRLCGHCCE